MMNATELKNGIYWVGAIDWNERNFHGYTTLRGSSYNAYLIIDEKITLIDSVKVAFADELLARISAVIDPAKIDYIVSNHVEPDHSGALPKLAQAAPNAMIITSAPNGLKGLTAHYGELRYKAVKTGESISIGKRTLTFVATPMVHWPDNMVTYCPEEKILFSNDAFGQHYASNKHFDDEVPLQEVMDQAQKYYANIVMPYSVQVQNALKAVAGLDIEIIAPSHGVIWRSHIAEIMQAYQKWSRNETDNLAVVVYDTMYHSTEKIAQQMIEAFTEKGIDVRVFDLKASHISEVMTQILTARYVAVGSPTLNNNMMPTVAAFLTYIKGLAPKWQGRKAVAFGSYGWGGQSVAQVQAALQEMGFEMPFENYRFSYVPTEEQLRHVKDTFLKAL